MQEWTNKWNSFNSYKFLLWRQHLEACSREEYLPPVTVDIDPSNRCMYNCKHCNAYDMIENSQKDMSEDHMIKLVDFLAEWRDSHELKTPNSACVAGGGESLLNKGIISLYERMHHHGMQIGVITSGFPMTDEHIEVLARTARWVGFSMDAGTTETYMGVKGIKNREVFGDILDKIRKLVKRVNHYKDQGKSICDVSFKYLLMPENAHEVYMAAVLARSLGVRDFHLRPAGWDNITKTKGTTISFDSVMESVNKQIEEARKLEIENQFYIYGVRHKFNPDFSRKVTFKRCWAIPMIPTFGADGNVHTCFDMRGREDLILCKHSPDPAEILKVWNTDFHRDMVRNINVEKCPRCTWIVANEIVENVILKDGMCVNFP